MRILLAMMKHETNTFSPVPTPWARFEAWSACFGDEVIKAYGQTNMTLSAYLKVAEAAGAEIVTPVAAEAMPSGIVEADAYNKMADAIVAACADGGLGHACLLERYDG